MSFHRACQFPEWLGIYTQCTVLGEEMVTSWPSSTLHFAVL